MKGVRIKNKEWSDGSGRKRVGLEEKHLADAAVVLGTAGVRRAAQGNSLVHAAAVEELANLLVSGWVEERREEREGER